MPEMSINQTAIANSKQINSLNNSSMSSASTSSSSSSSSAGTSVNGRGDGEEAISELMVHQFVVNDEQRDQDDMLEHNETLKAHIKDQVFVLPDDQISSKITVLFKQDLIYIYNLLFLTN